MSIELTQERLNEIHWLPTISGTAFSRFVSKQDIIHIIEEATGEKVTIVEPEPETPSEVIRSVMGATYGVSFADVKAALVAAYNAGWGGLRK